MLQELWTESEAGGWEGISRSKTGYITVTRTELPGLRLGVQTVVVVMAAELMAPGARART